MKKSIKIIIGKILLFAMLAQAQQPVTRFERITSDEGLSQNLVWKILQDRKGFLWFCTKDGLNKYDGYKFTYYRYEPNDSNTLSPGHVQMLHECPSGFLWIGTGGETIDILDEKTEQFTHVHLHGDHAKTTNLYRIAAIVEKNPEEHWIRMDNGDLYRVRGPALNDRNVQNPYGNYSITTFDSLNHRSLFYKWNPAISADNSGRLWLNTDEGFGSIVNDSITVFSPLQLPPNTPPAIENIEWTEFRASDSSLWIATRGILMHIKNDEKEPEQFLLRFDALPDKRSKTSYDGDSIKQETKAESFWVSSEENILKINVRTQRIEQVLALPDDVIGAAKRVFSMLEDEGGILWLGTPGAGVIKYNPIYERFSILKEKNWGNSINNSCATFLKYQDRPPTSSETGEANFNQRAVTRDRKGRYWILDRSENEARLFRYDSANRSLKKYDSRTPPFLNYAFAIRGIAADDSGIIWIGAFNILTRFDPERETVEHFYPKNDSMKRLGSPFPVPPDGIGIGSTFFKDRNGKLWWDSANRGLFCFDPMTSQLQVYRNIPNDSSSISHNEIISINENPLDTSDILWVGTEGGGLNLLDKTREKFTRYTTHNGLPNNVINGILFDGEGNAWLSTNLGICKFHPSKGVIKTFDVNDGLQGNEFDRFKYFKSSDGMMFFGGVNGINAFYPEQVEDNSHIPPLSLTELRLQNRTVSISDANSPLSAVIGETTTLVLPYDKNIITFEFAALDFSNTLKNLYSYKLDGFNASWSYPSVQRTASYTNLDPGQYVFRLRGSNNDGIWNMEGISLTLIILPPWYMTWWFYTLSVLTIVGTTYGLVRRRIKRLQKERQVQEEFSRELLARQEAERKRISGELHDSVGQNILLMKNRAHFGIQGTQDLPSAHAQLNEIASLATDTLNQVREISHNLRPLHLDRLGLTQAIHMLLDQVERNSTFKIEANVESIDNFLEKEQEVNIFRIVQECLNNVLKHSKAQRVSVTTHAREQDIQIIIQDDGVGFDFDQKQRLTRNYGMGLSGLSERAKIIGGELRITSSPGNGTTTFLEVPIVKPPNNII